MASEKKQLRILLTVLDGMEVKYKEDVDLDGAKAKLEKAIEGGKAPDELSEEQATILNELGYEVETPTPKKKAKDEDDSDDEDEKPAKKAKKSDEDDEDEKPKAKKKAAPKEDEEEEEKPKKKAKAKSDDEDEEKPAKKPKKAAKEEEEEDGEDKITARQWLLNYFKANKKPERDELKAAYLEEFGKDKENTLHGALWRAKTSGKFLGGKLLVEKKIFSLVKVEEAEEPVEEEEEEEKPAKTSKKPSKKDDDEDEKPAKKPVKKAKKPKDDEEE